MSEPALRAAGDLLHRVEDRRVVVLAVVDLETGKAEGRVTKPSLMAVIQDLHRGKNSGSPGAG